MNEPAYNAPLLSQYRDGFVGRTLAERHAVETRIFRDLRFSRGLHDVWVYFKPIRRARTRGRKLLWQPKLYLCLQPRYYWKSIGRLVSLSGSLNVSWKFYMAPEGYERPDKIVFYPSSAHELSRVARRIARILGGVEGHELRHAGPGPVAPGVLYVGSDPVFLRQSWRMYRCVAHAWSRINARHLEARPGGLRAWLGRMNLSGAHEGPAELRPRADEAFIKRQWKSILPRAV